MMLRILAVTFQPDSEEQHRNNAMSELINIVITNWRDQYKNIDHIIEHAEEFSNRRINNFGINRSL